MQTAKDQLEFVIRFVNGDLDHYRPGDWLNFRDDFELFLGCKAGAPTARVGPIETMPLYAPMPQDMTPDDYKTLQTETKNILENFVKGRGQDKSELTTTPLAVRATLWPLDSLSSRFAGRSFLSLTGATRDIFLMMVFMLFAFESTARIGACAECERIMLRTKKREYCSSRCQTRAYMRRYRQQETVKQQENEQAHTRYAKRAKERSGGKAQRRPRGKKGGTAR